jgi:hypothetical protein
LVAYESEQARLAKRAVHDCPAVGVDRFIVGETQALPDQTDWILGSLQGIRSWSGRRIERVPPIDSPEQARYVAFFHFDD